MISSKTHRVICLMFALVVLLMTAPHSLAQEASQSTRPPVQREDDTNLDTQLYLILATNRDIEDAKVPTALEPVLKRLRESLTFKHYNLAATFLNRVKNGGKLDVSWVGGPLLITSSSATGNPSFNQFGAVVRLIPDNNGNEIVRMTDFRFGSRVPIVTGAVGNTNASTGGAAFPVINYESVGLHTDISMREGVPVIAGTLNIGPSSDAIVVAIAVRRAVN
jgi:hypothetical protein